MSEQPAFVPSKALLEYAALQEMHLAERAELAAELPRLAAQFCNSPHYGIHQLRDLARSEREHIARARRAAQEAREQECYRAVVAECAEAKIAASRPREISVQEAIALGAESAAWLQRHQAERAAEAVIAKAAEEHGRFLDAAMGLGPSGPLTVIDLEDRQIFGVRSAAEPEPPKPRLSMQHLAVLAGAGADDADILFLDAEGQSDASKLAL